MDQVMCSSSSHQAHVLPSRMKGGDGHILFQGQSQKLLTPHKQKLNQWVLSICKGGWEMWCLLWEELIQGDNRSLSKEHHIG